MTRAAATLWRVFPWDPSAREGDRFTATHAPTTQGSGRFDLRARPGGVMYFAETPEHAVAETIQHYRGQVLSPDDLVMAGRALALISASIPPSTQDRVVDLCDPTVLVRLDVRPDDTAARERRVTQGIASAIQREGAAGIRWWSSFFGEWHTVVLFRDRATPEYGRPEPLDFENGELLEAARLLGVRIR